MKQLINVHIRCKGSCDDNLVMPLSIYEYVTSLLTLHAIDACFCIPKFDDLQREAMSSISPNTRKKLVADYIAQCRQCRSASLSTHEKANTYAKCDRDSLAVPTLNLTTRVVLFERIPVVTHDERPCCREWQAA